MKPDKIGEKKRVLCFLFRTQKDGDRTKMLRFGRATVLLAFRKGQASIVNTIISTEGHFFKKHYYQVEEELFYSLLMGLDWKQNIVLSGLE